MPNSRFKDDRVRDFLAALRRFGEDDDESSLARFAAGANAGRFDAHGERREVAAYRRKYRAPFTALSTAFTDDIEGQEQAAPERVRGARPTSGHPRECRGVLVPVLQGSSIGAACRCRDCAALVRGPWPTRRTERMPRSELPEETDVVLARATPVPGDR